MVHLIDILGIYVRTHSIFGGKQLLVSYDCTMIEQNRPLGCWWFTVSPCVYNPLFWRFNRPLGITKLNHQDEGELDYILKIYLLK